MKRYFWSISMILTILLAACGSPTPLASSPAAPAPVEVENIPSADVVISSAVIAPVQVTRLSFIISGLIKEIKVKEGDKVQTGQSLVMLDTSELEFAVMAADAAYRSASINAELQDADRVRVVNENTGRVTFVSLPYELKQKAEAKAAQILAALDGAKANLVSGSLTAPFDGTIASVDVIAGELVQSGQVVLTLASLNDLQIETTDLSERDISRVKTGQSVNVYLEALDVTVTGKVILISPVSKTVGGDVVFPVTIKLDEQPEGLLWGMTAEVEIQTE
ncbi:efflux RND transporter periplasmic adaptor subunit [Candidatus Villigracilis saccharophilus]|uniref:efflux RND transporter periplasmic adaptor subunit n=1 Tax=Candidatus Villigracilis saccharophilus TaxID=3140684 RepID=UPI003136108A|nr:efflux RND transporter periplasmic adaptor subunit [Anaerolineales bacterium]